MITLASNFRDAKTETDVVALEEGYYYPQCDSVELYWWEVDDAGLGPTYADALHGMSLNPSPLVCQRLAYGFHLPLLREMWDRDLKLAIMRVAMVDDEAAQLLGEVYCLGLPFDIATRIAQVYQWEEINRGLIPQGAIEFI